MSFLQVFLAKTAACLVFGVAGSKKMCEELFDVQQGLTNEK